MKKCADCLITKPSTYFHSCSSRADGLAHYCKECKKVRARAYYIANQEREKEKMRLYRLAKPEAVSEAKKRCYRNNTAKYKAMQRALYERKREQILAYCAEYRIRNKAEISARDSEYVKRRMAYDEKFKLSYVIRCRLGSAFRRQKIPKRGKTRDMLGCDWDFLKLYIEERFLPGMSWDNRRAWHIDHIIPLSSAKNVEEMERLCHYSNLQPLWAADNIRKGARMAA